VGVAELDALLFSMVIAPPQPASSRVPDRRTEADRLGRKALFKVDAMAQVSGGSNTGSYQNLNLSGRYAVTRGRQRLREIGSDEKTII
jgi:hypothetical protein